MIELVTTNGQDRAVWETIMDINEWFRAPWTLIGPRMVQLHAMSVGREVPRLSLDADALADVRAMPGSYDETGRHPSQTRIRAPGDEHLWPGA